MCLKGRGDWETLLSAPRASSGGSTPGESDPLDRDLPGTVHDAVMTLLGSDGRLTAVRGQPITGIRSERR